MLKTAREAKGKAVGAAVTPGGPEVAFAQGQAIAYDEVVSHLVSQLDVFEIERASIGVAPSLDVDRDLL